MWCADSSAISVPPDTDNTPPTGMCTSIRSQFTARSSSSHESGSSCTPTAQSSTTPIDRHYEITLRAHEGIPPPQRYRLSNPDDSTAVSGSIRLRLARVSAAETAPARIPPGGFRELGPVGWVIAKAGAKQIRAPRFTLFTVLGQHKLLFLAWLPFGAYLLGAGKLPRKDAELVILRVGHLRNCEYELQQHRRLARSRGVDADLQAKIFEGPDA